MKILLVDDSAVARRSVAAMLMGAGVDVDVAPNGREALRRLDPGLYDAVIVDIVMPEMDGFETIRAIRARDAELRIVAVTSRVPGLGPSGNVDYLKFASAFGAHATLRKPFSRDELLTVLGLLPGAT